jgi:nicotinate (nicotinamide) nucleotide adenylyltransferase
VRPALASSDLMRIGIFGGTFNPIHLAHLRSAEEVRAALRLDHVLFIPSAAPPHKRSDGLTSPAHRLAMVRLAIRGNPHFRVSTIEIERRGRSYSVDTLRALRRRIPGARFFFIMGMDAFREIATWKEYRSLFALSNIVVTSRPPYDDTPLPYVTSFAIVPARRDWSTVREIRACASASVIWTSLLPPSGNGSATVSLSAIWFPLRLNATSRGTGCTRGGSHRIDAR